MQHESWGTSLFTLSGNVPPKWYIVSLSVCNKSLTLIPKVRWSDWHEWDLGTSLGNALPKIPRTAINPAAYIGPGKWISMIFG